ncbi:MAG: CPBP family intramembrane metalloprotease [Oscillospiraceae bacterium]|nr:CPBP family intramembrane metalloprotease [Oscillospiraceae bacterium]
MPNPDYAEISPVDLRNPFRNPTEEPDYSPDYRAIAPELGMPGSSLPLFPARAERSRIRRYFSLAFFTLILGFVVTLGLYLGLRMLCAAVLKQVDLRKIGDLPQNYMLIADQYMDDSAIHFGILLISVLCGNLTAFLIGCRMTGIRKRTLFRLRDFRFPRMCLYIMAGLWIGLLSGMLSDLLVPFLRQNRIPVVIPELSLRGSNSRMMLIVLYTCLIEPVTEELLLRGVVLKNASRVSQRFGIFLSAFLFAVMHENLPQFLLALPLGILLAYITIRHNSLMPAIIVHMAVNGAAVLRAGAETVLDAGTLHTAELVSMLGILLLGTASVFYLFLTEHMPEKTPHQCMRGMRLAGSSPLFWAFLCIHAAVMLYAIM